MAGDLQLRAADAADGPWIHRLRHRVYAEELGQHQANPAAELYDALDGLNTYLVAARGDQRVGFVSITPPWAGRFGLDKYLSRAELPALEDAGTFEVRILTVEQQWRRSGAATALMYAALRWIASRGGRVIVAMGRSEVLAMYRAVGLRPTGRVVRSGAATFEVMTASVAELTAMAGGSHAGVVAEIAAAVDWRLDAPFAARPDGCEHGGASFGAIGVGFRSLERRLEVVAADVLDAWFPPAPGVRDALAADPGWMARTSPPTDAEGLRAEIAEARGIGEASVAVGAGSSDLIFRAFGRWLTAASRVLLVDPGYGEYAHIAGRVIGCDVDRFRLRSEDGWRIDPERLAAVAGQGRHDLIVVVNPNNPTGRHLSAAELREAIAASPESTRWWIDEAYLGYVGFGESLADLAAADPRVVVCASMSKMYALSGMRAAYLVAVPAAIAELRRWTPPWAVSLPAQLAAVAALRDPGHYREQWARTAALRHELAGDLAGIGAGLEVDAGVANFVTVMLPPGGISAARLAAACRAQDVFLRDLSPLSTAYEGRGVRIAVRGAVENQRIVSAIAGAVAGDRAPVSDPAGAGSR